MLQFKNLAEAKQTPIIHISLIHPTQWLMMVETDARLQYKDAIQIYVKYVIPKLFINFAKVK